MHVIILDKLLLEKNFQMYSTKNLKFIKRPLLYKSEKYAYIKRNSFVHSSFQLIFFMLFSFPFRSSFTHICLVFFFSIEMQVEGHTCKFNVYTSCI